MGDWDMQTGTGIRFEWGGPATEAEQTGVTEAAQAYARHWAALPPSLPPVLPSPHRAAIASGRRLAAMGFLADAAIATEDDVCALMPVRDGDGAFAPG